MAQPTLTPLPPAEAVAALQRRGGRLDPTFSWQDAWEAEHATMFTVAKSAGFDILKDIHAGLVEALAEGRTFQDFAKDLRPVLEKKGWWGRQQVTDPATGEIQERTLGSPRRLKTIFEANMRVSYAAGHWAKFERTKATRPVLRYVSLLFGKDRRKQHIVRHNLALPVDDAYWDTWAPPCGYGCECTLQSLSLRDVERMKGELKFTPPAETYRNFVNSRTGQITRVPDGIDPGWGYNPGKAGWRASTVADKLIDAPPELAAAATASPAWPARALATEFETWFDLASTGKPLDRSTYIVGAIRQDVLDALAQRGVTPSSGAISVDGGTVGHMVRDAKASAGKAVPLDLLRTLPLTLDTAKAVLRDLRDGALLYVFDVPSDPRLGKIVIKLDFPVKVRPAGGRKTTIQINAIRTAGLVSTADLSDIKTYEVLSGAL
ncbi:phage head morphogenesis protein [Methylobacterium sp. Leaf85]|uniref:phage head morphogenesis protein n=1 Tax=Methylobacterium sp. Leaf85 TaxID=1736241 RepID=UPI0006FB82A2|nr:phage minor head protein [Methylobacterium sp. Leaf85]KQO53080.1 hypothetical protein ASF08_19335 [Methylobacterium sp. Leaf85]